MTKEIISLSIFVSTTTNFNLLSIFRLKLYDLKELKVQGDGNCQVCSLKNLLEVTFYMMIF